MKSDHPESQANVPVGHADYLDGWRGLAIALVLEGHFFNVIPLETGRIGVDVFFCLSGFLMSGLLFIRRQPLPNFYKRRMTRILPAFFLFVAAIYSYAWLQHRDFSAADVLSTLLFLRTYLPTGTGIWDTGIPIGHLWSLNIEEHCYVFMTLIVLLRRHKGHEGLILIMAGTACIAIGFLYVKMGRDAPRWGELGTEVAASHLLISSGYRLVREKYNLVFPPCASLLAVGMALMAYSGVFPWWTASLLTPFLLAFSVNHLSQTHGWFKSALSTPVLRYLGLWSFSLYLWQQPFYLDKAAFPGGPLFALTAAVALALVSYYAWEKPLRSWLNRHW